RGQHVRLARYGRVSGCEMDGGTAPVRPRRGPRLIGELMARDWKFMMATAAVFLAPVCGRAQFVLTKEQMVAYTSENPYERFADGRPKVPDYLLERVTPPVIDAA